MTCGAKDRECALLSLVSDGTKRCLRQFKGAGALTRMLRHRIPELLVIRLRSIMRV